MCDIFHVMANHTTRIMLFAALVAPIAASAQTNAPALTYVVSNAYVEIW